MLFQLHQLVMSPKLNHQPDVEGVYTKSYVLGINVLRPTSNNHLPLPPTIYKLLPKVHKERLGLPNRQ